MKKKYIVSLVVIGIMLVFVLTIGTGYGLFISTHKNNEKSATTLNCFKVYFSNGEIIEMNNIDPVINEEGAESSPYTLTITNICENTKELQVRLNVLKESTADINALTIKAAGNIDKEITLYKNLTNTKTTEENVAHSKLIGLITVKPNETVRTNIKMWFDEKKAPNMSKEEIFKAKFELIDTESSIKSTFAEILLNDISSIDKKANPDFNNISTQEEGLYKLENKEGNNYYYRGVVNNNYVKFANYTWRIIKINSDQTIKLILDKSATTMNYSEYTNAMDYTGLKYIYNDETINNNINNYLETWYQTNIIDRGFDKYISNSSFCNDSSYFINNYHTYFNGYKRLITEKNPTLDCPTTDADFGGIYNQKIGLITADEVALAGGVFNINNFNYYLYNGETFFTMTPSEYYNYNASIFVVNNNGALTTTQTNTSFGIRPVISLKSEITVSGSGIITDPYIIDES